MALNDHIERWALQQSVDRLALAVTNGQISLEDLGEIARRKPVFVSKYALVQQHLESMPNPREQQEYDSLMSQYEMGMMSEDMFMAMSAYINKWGNNAAASERVDEVKKLQASIKENIDYERLQNRAPSDIERHAIGGVVPSIEIEQALKMYLDQWGDGKVASDEHLNNAEAWLRKVKALRKEALENEWKLLFDHEGNLKSIHRLKEFAQNNIEENEYSDRIDDCYWNWVLEQADVVTAASDYNIYYRGVGKHSDEISKLNTLQQEWQTVDQSDIFEVIRYVETHPKSPFRVQADRLMQVLKAGEIERMRQEPSIYSDAKFRRLSASGACTKEELVDAVGGSEEVYNRILNLEKIRRERLRPIPNPNEQTFAEGGSGLTDIVFFGMPSSGKTCVLTGLFASDRLTPDASDWNGRYATALQSYGEAMIAPPRTTTKFVAVVSCDIFKKDKGRDLKIPFNLVDMAGEDFQNQIVRIDDLDNAAISFDSMGQGAPQILGNNHDKVFFVLIDPTATGSREVIQKDAIRTLIGLFENPVNRKIMSRVRGLHFIVTKADTLGANRGESAKRAVHSILNEGSRIKLINFCKDLSINASKDEGLDGRPRIFCFSLGSFHPGNIYSGSQKDSETILDVISDYVTAEMREGIAHKVRKIFTRPIW